MSMMSKESIEFESPEGNELTAEEIENQYKDLIEKFSDTYKRSNLYNDCNEIA
jgi:hypothetical protein